MRITQENDGEFYDIFIEDAGRKFHYEVNIRNDKDGTFVSYENADGEVFTLLEVDKSGAIINDKPVGV